MSPKFSAADAICDVSEEDSLFEPDAACVSAEPELSRYIQVIEECYVACQKQSLQYSSIGVGNCRP